MFLLGHFDIYLMYYNEHKPRNKFLDSLASNSYLPYIVQSSQNTSHSRTLIHNIFSNVISKNFICGKLQLPPLTIYPNPFSQQTHLLIHPSINLMFLKDFGQHLTRKILSWTTFIKKMLT